MAQQAARRPRVARGAAAAAAPARGLLLALLALACLADTAGRGASAASCGHNAVRHRQEEQLNKLLGGSYRRAAMQRRLQATAANGSSSSGGGGGAQPQTRLQKLLSTSQASTMRVLPVYQLEAGYIREDQAQQLKQVLVPGAINVLQQYIKVRIPSSRPIRAVRESIDQYCGEADANTVFRGEGFNGTDQVYYVTALNTGSCSDNVIAYTIICHLEPFTYRPNVAAINLCPKFWAVEPAGDKQVAALVHEMIHGLGFSDRMYPFLYDSATGVQYDEVVREHQLGGVGAAIALPHLPGAGAIGAISAAAAGVLPRLPVIGGGGAGAAAYQRSGDRLLDAEASSAGAAAAGASRAAADAAAEAAAFVAAAQRKVLFLVTPRLAAFAREYYGCPSLPGAPADAMSEGSHWRQANINHELMQPASAEDSQRRRVSQFTLNFLDDTGWYVTDKSSAQELEWGRGAGCGFVLDGCSAYAAANRRQAYYCDAGQAGKDVCTYDSRGVGVCSAIPGTSCHTARADATHPLLYCQDASSFGRSGREGFAASIAAVGGQVGSPSSRCFHTPQRVCTSGGKDACSGEDGSAVCVETACDGSGKLSVLLRIQGGGGKSDVARLPCTDGDVLDLPKLVPGKFKSGQLVCPNAATVCPTLGCAQACTNGYCWKGRCYCHMEFTGPGCTQSLVPSFAPRQGQSAPALPAAG